MQSGCKYCNVFTIFQMHRNNRLRHPWRHSRARKLRQPVSCSTLTARLPRTSGWKPLMVVRGGWPCPLDSAFFLCPGGMKRKRKTEKPLHPPSPPGVLLSQVSEDAQRVVVESGMESAMKTVNPDVMSAVHRTSVQQRP